MRVRGHHLILIPGLGVDERLFSCLTLDPRFPQTVIKWIPPVKNENLAAYAARLASQIPPAGKLIFIGVSFGGIIATELAKLFSPELTVIISSIKSKTELPYYYRLAGALKLPYWLPLNFAKHFHAGQHFFFGPKTPTEKKMLHQIIRETDIGFVKWALTQIARWPNKTVVPNLVHLHGTHDKLLLAAHLRNFIPIKKGTHFMIMSEAALISQIINQELGKLKAL